MAEPKPEQPPVVTADDDDDEEEVEEELKQEQKDELLIKACKENNLEEAQHWLAKQASPTCERDGWNPLLWAASNGNEDLVRLLVKHNACAPYLTNSTSDEGADKNQHASSSGVVGEEEYDPFVKPKDA